MGVDIHCSNGGGRCKASKQEEIDARNVFMLALYERPDGPDIPQLARATGLAKDSVWKGLESARRIRKNFERLERYKKALKNENLCTK